MVGGGIGEEGVEWLLTQLIRAAQKSGVIDEDSAKRVAEDKVLAHLRAWLALMIAVIIAAKTDTDERRQLPSAG